MTKDERLYEIICEIIEEETKSKVSKLMYKYEHAHSETKKVGLKNVWLDYDEAEAKKKKYLKSMLDEVGSEGTQKYLWRNYLGLE